MFTTIRLEEFVPANHPLRPIRTWRNAALTGIDARFSAMYEPNVQGGRPSIAPEKLMRAMLLQVLYSIRSERLLAVTEHASVDDYAQIVAALKPLRDGGLKQAVDDAVRGIPVSVTFSGGSRTSSNWISA